MLRKVLYLIRPSSFEDAADSLLFPVPAAGDVDVTVILLEGAEESPVQARRMFRLVSDRASSVKNRSDATAISYADMLGQVFESDTVIVL